MSHMKPTRTIRLSAEGRNRLRKKFARLSLNPVLLGLSYSYVQWEGIPSDGKLSPNELVVRARNAFPRLPLSWAVEGCIAHLLSGNVEIGIKPSDEYLPLTREEGVRIRRFQKLTPTQKIRFVERIRKLQMD